MADELTDSNPMSRLPFHERYPDYALWLNGSTWELDPENDLVDSIPQFRASLYYHARTMGLKLRTKTITRDGKEYFLVRGD